eukprot:1290366-Pyramimonas_sp.AAC.1
MHIWGAPRSEYLFSDRAGPREPLPSSLSALDNDDDCDDDGRGMVRVGSEYDADDDEDVSSGLLVLAFLRGGRQGYCTAAVRAQMVGMSQA